MDAVGKELLAGAGLAGDEDVGIVGLTELLGDLHPTAHAVADRDDIPEGVFCRQSPADQPPADLPLLLQDLGGRAGGDQRADGRSLAADEPVLDHIPLPVQCHKLLISVPAGTFPAADEGQGIVDFFHRLSLPLL